MKLLVMSQPGLYINRLVFKEVYRNKTKINNRSVKNKYI